MVTKTLPGSHQAITSVNAAPVAPTRLELRLAWARDTLGVSAGASQAEVRRAFLAGLPGEEFVPGESWLEAYRTLVNENEGVADVIDPAEFLRHEAEQLHERIEKFAQGMFSLPVETRQRQHEQLCGLALPDTRALARLNALRPGVGLNVALPEGGSPQFTALLEYLVELFPLCTATRAARRAEIVESLEPEIQVWETAARSFKSRHPKLAALDQALVETLASWSSVERSATRAKSTPRPEVETKNSSWWDYGGRTPILVIILGGLIVGVGTSALREATRPPPNFTPPPYQFNLQDFTPPAIDPATDFEEIRRKLREQAETTDEPMTDGEVPEGQLPFPTFPPPARDQVRESLPGENR